VRRSREEAARTRRNAVAAASRLFRQRGIEAVSVADVMAQVGLTAGGFYRHFESKEALLKEACAEAFAHSGLARQPGNSPAAILRHYLSKGHRDAPSAGCPLPALASEMPRQPAGIRHTYTDGVRLALARIGEVVPGADAPARLALLCSMIGAVAVARAVDDEELSEALLRETSSFWIRALAKPRPRRRPARRGDDRR
jgi:TetR/AcrR family transcriptional regulator, transcriptional repressor for nem operon